MAAIRQRYDDQIQRISAVFDRFKGLKPGDMEGDVDLWREMQDRYGDYFEGCMGAEAIKKRLQDFDLEGAAKQLREEIDTGHRPAQGPRPEAPEGRQRLPDHRQQAGGHGAGRDPGHPRRICARWCSWTAAVSRPPT